MIVILFLILFNSILASGKELNQKVSLRIGFKGNFSTFSLPLVQGHCSDISEDDVDEWEDAMRLIRQGRIDWRSSKYTYECLLCSLNRAQYVVFKSFQALESHRKTQRHKNNLTLIYRVPKMQRCYTELNSEI
jgi:hypothetical protein